MMYEVLPSMWPLGDKVHRRGDRISAEVMEELGGRVDSYRRLGFIRPVDVDWSKATKKELEAEAVSRHVVVPAKATKKDIAQLLEAT